MAQRRGTGEGPSKVKAGLLGGALGAGQGYAMSQMLDQAEEISPEERACLLQKGVWREETASCHEPITGETIGVLGQGGLPSGRRVQNHGGGTAPPRTTADILGGLD